MFAFCKGGNVWNCKIICRHLCVTTSGGNLIGESYVWIFRAGINPIIVTARLMALIGCYILMSDLLRELWECLWDEEDDDLQ